TLTPIKPSAAIRPAFLAALARPFFRNKSTACSISPPVSFSAPLQSIMPAPVRSRSSLTICALIFAISMILRSSCGICWRKLRACGADPAGQAWLALPRMTELLFCGQLLGLRDPTVHAAGQPGFLADLASGVCTEPGDLPIVEDAEIVELLLDRRRHVMELLEIIGDPARS